MSWFARWFADALYLDLYRHRDGEEARQAADLLFRMTGLAPDGALLLDLACGTGRHAFEFARRGARVTAADLSPTLLDVARRTTQKHRGTVLLARCDMRRLPFRRAFDGVAQLFTAFGYFTSDDENAGVIAGVARVLRPGGWYMLDFLNAGDVRANLVAHSEQQLPHGRVVQERAIEGNRVVKRITLTAGGEQRSFEESVRLFTPAELDAMMEANGFAVRRRCGSYAGEPFHSTSPRCILFAQCAL
jgi:SAM-dependent methyltransferase